MLRTTSFRSALCATPMANQSRNLTMRHIGRHGNTSVGEDEGFAANCEANPGVGGKAQATYGLLTVREGDRIAMWSRRGSVRFVDGPSQQFVWGSSILPLKLHVAGDGEFLRVLKKNGEKEYLYGPTSVWEDPIAFKDVKLMKAITINTSEAIVVYREKKGAVSRRVVHGPAMHTPAENEWMHRFVWHGADPNSPTIQRKVPTGLNFTKLRLVPDQMYYDVESVRTKDDAQLIVKTVVFFQLADVERMVDNTHDPVSDFVNSIAADVVEMTSSFTFEEFRANTHQFNDVNTYKVLLEKAERIGYKITKVVFRGYEASTTLQQMHDHAIEQRTHLRLQEETKEQEQTLLDQELLRENQRKQIQRSEEERRVTHDHEMERQHADQAIALQMQQHRVGLEKTDDLHVSKLKHDEQIAAQRLIAQKALQGVELDHYKALANLGVDLSAVLVAKEQGPAHRTVRIEQSPLAGGSSPALHLHEDA